MPVVSCPKCPTKLRVADGATGNVKCPKCQTIFPAVAAPAFEVVDDTPAKPAAKPAAPPPVPAAKAAKPAAENDFDFDTSPKKKRRDDDDDEDDDDRPRKKKRRDDDDDDDDRPRSKRRRDDDDDDDDRPRKKKRRRDDNDDYDDEDEFRPSKKKGGGFGPAKTGTLLLGISLWMYMATFALMALFTLIGLAAGIPEGIMAIPGLTGAGSTILMLVALSFCIAGPSKSRGIAIGAVVVAGIHLVLVIIAYSNAGVPIGYRGERYGSDTIGWRILAENLHGLNSFLPNLIYGRGGFSGALLMTLITAALELTRFILVCLTIKSLATAAKDYDAAEKAGKGVVIASIVCGAGALASTLVNVIIVEARMISGALYLGAFLALAILVGYALTAMTGAFAAMQTKDSLARRARRG